MYHSFKNIATIGIVVGGIALASYPIMIAPYLNPGSWAEVQKQNRKGIDVEKIQPGGMKVWSDPFERKKD